MRILPRAQRTDNFQEKGTIEVSFPEHTVFATNAHCAGVTGGSSEMASATKTDINRVTPLGRLESGCSFLKPCWYLKLTRNLAQCMFR